MRASILRYLRGELGMVVTLAISYVSAVITILLAASLVAGSTWRPAHVSTMAVGACLIILVLLANARAAVRTLGDAQEKWWQKIVAVGVVVVLAAALYSAAFSLPRGTP